MQSKRRLWQKIVRLCQSQRGGGRPIRRGHHTSAAALWEVCPNQHQHGTLLSKPLRSRSHGIVFSRAEHSFTPQPPPAPPHASMRQLSKCVGGASLQHLNVAFLVMLLHCCHTHGVAAQKVDSALMVMEDTGAGGSQDEEAVVEDDEEELEVLQPTKEWQTLRPGQAVPAGSHVRLNLQTGQREVRLGKEQLRHWTQDRQSEEKEEKEEGSSISAQELKEALKKMKEDMKVASRGQQQEPQLQPLDLQVETDAQILQRLLDQLSSGSSSSSTQQKLSILQELEYMVHQVDNAQTLCSMGGLELILEGLNSSDFRVQESSAFVLGSALSSNPVVQVRAVEGGASHTLLTMLATVRPYSVKKKALFAVSSLLRHCPPAQRHLLSHGGLSILSQLFTADEAGTLRPRITTILHDLITEQEAPGEDQDLDVDLAVELQEQLVQGGWCRLVPQLLQSSEHDHREKALEALLKMRGACLEQFASERGLLDSLSSLGQQYQELLHSPQTPAPRRHYYQQLLQLVLQLQEQIH